MAQFQGFYATLMVCLLSLTILIQADNEYMISKPEQMTLDKGFQTKLICDMNIEPDKFLWKFYPTNDYYNAKVDIDLNSAKFKILPDKRNEQKPRKKSALTIVADDESIAGDYQCLAYYGASVVASIPWRITVSKFGQFPYQKNNTVFVTEGNTVSWHCLAPESNPKPYIDYYRNDREIIPSKYSIGSLLLQNVSYVNNGRYGCIATLNKDRYKSNAVFILNVANNLPHSAPSFIEPPQKTYEVIRGESIFLDCSAIGNPVPKVIWKKKNGVLPEKRVEIVNGGLKVKNISSTDDGIYECIYTNTKGSVTHLITVVYNEEPSIECKSAKSVNVQQGEDFDIECIVNGTPKPRISWLLNGFSVTNDSSIETNYNRIYLKPIEKRHAGNIQIFARNAIKTVYKIISIRVTPLSTNDSSNQYRHNNKKNNKKSTKHGKNKASEMIPPTKPIISRVNDESVMVRWSVPVNEGLPIRFFKVQYRELGPAYSNHSHRMKGWKTTNADIPPSVTNFEVPNLKPDYIYKFRIAAVYSNDDNNNSNNSDKFHLKKLDFEDRNPLPVPSIVHTETINSSSVRIHWKYTPNSNISVEGFYLSYISSSKAGDYMTATVDGKNAKSYILSHLQPDMFYDIKLQTFTSKGASDFSPIMKAKTSALPISTINPVPKTTPKPSTSNSKLYVFIVGGVIASTLVISVIVLLFICRKWKQKKTLDNNKTAVDDHHISMDGNEYVVNPKTLQRSNGCGLTTNRITITPNPLADADNKNQNLIEMSCMAAQNNNLTQPSNAAINGEQPASSKIKKREKNKRTKNSMDCKSSGENYV